MRLLVASELLLLLASQVAAGSYLSNRDETDKGIDTREFKLGKRKTEARISLGGVVDGATAPPQGRAYVGTEDAPIDGLDGKPRAGPFIYHSEAEDNGKEVLLAAEKSKPKSLDKFEEGAAKIPEKNDGVMDDDNRVAPKKGTTGTEGGVSEREKERKAKGNPETKPQGPNTAPPMPHSEEVLIQEKKEKKEATDAKDSKFYDTESEALGLEKPEGLPELPHSAHVPRPRSPSGARRQTPPSNTDNGWYHETQPYTEDQQLEPHDLWETGSTSLPGGDLEWHEWFHSFVLSLTMILFSEVGDKTFLVAALMAMRHDRLLVFSSAFSALVLMTILSAVLGHAVPALLPKRITTFMAALLFLVFGARMLREGLAMPKDSGVGEEMQEVEAELEEKEQSMARRATRSGSVSAATLESGRGRKHSTSNAPSRTQPSPPSSRDSSPGPKDRLAGLTNLLSLVLSPAWVQTFIMTFLGEWGDRSQIATIAMAAGQDYWWVTLGAILGHACCTGIAVIGGRALAGRVSMRVVTIGGAAAFLVFGVIYIYECIVERS